jgi:LmbE family N-acetylglucosaminyl deacetylase
MAEFLSQQEIDDLLDIVDDIEFNDVGLGSLCINNDESIFNSENNSIINQEKNDYKNYKDKSILIIETHWDDVLIGCLNTIKYYKYTHDIYIVTLCDNNGNISDKRKEIISEIYEKNNFNIIVPNISFTDTKIKMEHIHDIVKELDRIIQDIQPEIVLIPEQDLHYDHTNVNHASLVATRPTTENFFLMEVLEYQVPSSHNWDFNKQNVNYGYRYYPFMEPEMEQTIKELEKIKNHLGSGYDAKSIDMIYTDKKRNGLLVGCSYADRLKLVYQKM